MFEKKVRQDICNAEEARLFCNAQPLRALALKRKICIRENSEKKDYGWLKHGQN